MKAMSEYTGSVNGKRSLEEAISELGRECDVRRRLYDRWISEGRLSRIEAHDRLERLLTALTMLTKMYEPEAQAVSAPNENPEHT